MRKIWQIQEAKARFSQLIQEAKAHGPQQITHHGKIVAIMISSKEYERLKGPKISFLSFIQNSPIKGLELDTTRDQSLTREVDW
jgi:prevent-host-death family protein